MIQISHKISKPILQQWLIQSVFILITVLLSILTVTWILERSLVKQALELEAEAFISAYRADSKFPLPRTRNLIGYLVKAEETSSIPTSLANLPSGLNPNVKLLGRNKPVPVYVRDFDQNRLYLIFEGANIDRLVGVFGLVPMSITLIAIYIGSWIAYKVSWRAVSPLLSIAKNLRKTGPDNFSLELHTKNLSGETKELAEALDEYSKRIDLFVERERQFTADVSHELRTPLTIIDAAAQILEADFKQNDDLQNHAKHLERIQMIRRASKDINSVISAFFLLARDHHREAPLEPVNVVETVTQTVNKLSTLVNRKKITLALAVDSNFTTTTNKMALEIIIGNILGNAVKYTEQGRIDVLVTQNQIIVSDTGIGIPDELLPHLFKRHVRGRGLDQAGEGIGLAIVKRLCDQFDWEISIKNRPESGIIVTLSKQKKISRILGGNAV